MAISPKLRLYLEMDDRVDAFGVGGDDLYLRLDEREYLLRSALKLVEGLKSPCVDGRGLKHTLERRVFDLVYPQSKGIFQEFEKIHFHQAFIPVAFSRRQPLSDADVILWQSWNRARAEIHKVLARIGFVSGGVSLYA